MPTSIGQPGPPSVLQGSRDDTALRRVAQELESAFLSVMLKDAGVGRPLSGFGGCIGEEQFGSFLRDAYAAEFAKAGGIGLAETIFRSLAGGAADRVPPR
jgi:Rod binding domain-containing protein